MAKTIKFNLTLGGFPVRNIEGIQEHFSIEDMLKYYRSGLLKKWLEVRGYKDKIESLNSIGDNATQKKIMESLVEIFDVDVDPQKLEEALYFLDYKETEQDKMINDYHSGYERLVRHMIHNSNNMTALKADAQEMERSYFRLFELNYFSLFMELFNEARRAIYAFMTRDRLKDYFLGNKSDIPTIQSTIKDLIYTGIMPPDKIKEILRGDVKIVRRNTEGVWDPIEKDDVKVLVLCIKSPYTSDPCVVRRYQGQLGEELGMNDINGKFVTLDGLEYLCSDENCELMYMEV